MLICNNELEMAPWLSIVNATLQHSVFHCMRIWMQYADVLYNSIHVG